MPNNSPNNKSKDNIKKIKHLTDKGSLCLNVYLDGMPVGKLAKTKEGILAFQYDEEWLNNRYSISPFSLPLKDDVFIPKLHPFSGLHGIFDDSLPDGWGRLLLDRMLRQSGIDPFEIDPLVRLAIVGQSGMGALEYKPSIELAHSANMPDLDIIATECAEILRTDEAHDLDELFELGGSSGGARPKILTIIDGEDWIVKFPSSQDPKDIGVREYEMALRARDYGLEMPEVRLMESHICGGYFAIKRFDRIMETVSNEGQIKKKHMASAGALLETTHRIPNLDYDILLKLTLMLTNNISEVQRMFELMVFNVYAQNRDDHAKNFSFVCDDAGNWILSPAYDLTENPGINGEHATTVNGKGKEITDKDLKEVGIRAGLNPSIINSVIERVHAIFRKELID